MSMSKMLKDNDKVLKVRVYLECLKCWSEVLNDGCFCLIYAPGVVLYSSLISQLLDHVHSLTSLV